jgi:hypothetical protein
MRRKMTAFGDGGVNGLEMPRLQVFRARFQLSQSRNGRVRCDVVPWRLPSFAAGCSPGAPNGGSGGRPTLPPRRPMAPRADRSVVRRVDPAGRKAPWRPLGRCRLDGIHRWVRHSWLGFGVGIQSEPRHTGRPRSHMAEASLIRDTSSRSVAIVRAETARRSAGGACSTIATRVSSIIRCRRAPVAGAGERATRRPVFMEPSSPSITCHWPT